MKILAVDPGKNSGYVVYHYRKKRIIEKGTISENWDEKFLELLRRQKPSYLILERMEIRGRGFAAKDLLPIAEQVGRWAGIATTFEFSVDFVSYYTPSEWKGNSPKLVTKNRVLQQWPYIQTASDYWNEHEIDAAGILQYALEDIGPFLHKLYGT